MASAMQTYDMDKATGPTRSQNALRRTEKAPQEPPQKPAEEGGKETPLDTVPTGVQAPGPTARQRKEVTEQFGPEQRATPRFFKALNCRSSVSETENRVSP